MSNEDCIYGVPSEEVKTDLSFQHEKKKKNPSCDLKKKKKKNPIISKFCFICQNKKRPLLKW